MPKVGICFLVLISIRNACPTSRGELHSPMGLFFSGSIIPSRSLEFPKSTPAVGMSSKLVLLIGPFLVFVSVVFKLCPLVTFSSFQELNLS